MHQVIIKNVCLASVLKDDIGSYRIGTAFESLESFARKFGDPHEADYSETGLDGAGKVHAIWDIDTPRGLAHIRDYWWNAQDQLSIAAADSRAFLWVKNWLRIHGVRAEGGCGK